MEAPNIQPYSAVQNDKYVQSICLLHLYTLHPASTLFDEYRYLKWPLVYLITGFGLWQHPRQAGRRRNYKYIIRSAGHTWPFFEVGQVRLYLECVQHTCQNVLMVGKMKHLIKADKLQFPSSSDQIRRNISEKTSGRLHPLWHGWHDRAWVKWRCRRLGLICLTFFSN